MAGRKRKFIDRIDKAKPIAVLDAPYTRQVQKSNSKRNWFGKVYAIKYLFSDATITSPARLSFLSKSEYDSFEEAVMMLKMDDVQIFKLRNDETCFLYYLPETIYSSHFWTLVDYRRQLEIVKQWREARPWIR